MEQRRTPHLAVSRAKRSTSAMCGWALGGAVNTCGNRVEKSRISASWPSRGATGSRRQRHVQQQLVVDRRCLVGLVAGAHVHHGRCWSIQPRSTAQSLVMSAVTGSVSSEMADRTTSSPIEAAHWRELPRGRSAVAWPSIRRSAYRSVHDAIANARNISGGAHDTGASPSARYDTAAPAQMKQTPAYAHSLTSPKPGTAIAIAAATWHMPRM